MELVTAMFVQWLDLYNGYLDNTYSPISHPSNRPEYYHDLLVPR